jgi:protein O-GlcNAc transferase
LGRFEHLEMGDWQPQRPDRDEKPNGVLDQDYYLGKAQDAFAADDYERALGYYSRTLQYESNLEEAWLGQLRCLIELGELPEAVVWSNRALERFPKSARILSARAIAEARLGRQAAAISYSDSAFAAQGVDAYAWVARGDVLVPVNTTNSRACFAKAIEMSPNDWTIRAWIARAYLVRRQFHLALEYFNQAVMLSPERFTCWHWIGRCCRELGRADEAVGAFRRALAVCPGFQPAQVALRELESRGTASRAVDTLRRIFRRRQASGG